VVPGPFSAAAPVNVVTGAVLTGWAGFPFGWAFDVSAVIAPAGVWAVLLQAIVGFMPHMTWLQVIAWTSYILIVGAFFLRGVRRARPRPRRVSADAAAHPPSLTSSSPGAA